MLAVGDITSFVGVGARLRLGSSPNKVRREALLAGVRARRPSLLECPLALAIRTVDRQNIVTLSTDTHLYGSPLPPNLNVEIVGQGCSMVTIFCPFILAIPSMTTLNLGDRGL